MDKLKATITEICPSPYGYAIFLNTELKTFVIYVDGSRGCAVQSAFEKYSSERPLTHEFVANMLDGLECMVKEVVIYHSDNGTFFTKMKLEMDNELGKKIVEIDGRPSDTFSIALRVGAPIYVDAKVLGKLPDMTGALKKLRGDL